MPRPRFAKLEAIRRDALLDLAAEEFAAHGFAAASLNRVLERAGFSKGAFYYYFDDKADLLTAVLERSWEVLLPASGVDLAELDARTFWPTIERLFVEMLARTQQHPWVSGIGRLIYHPPAEAGVQGLVAEQLRRARTWLGALLARGRALDVVRSDLPDGLLMSMTFAAFEAADRWLVEHWEELDRESLADMADRLFATLRRIVAPAP